MSEITDKRRKNIKNMTKLKIAMDEYGNLFAILPDGDARKIVADVYGNPYYGAVRISETIEEETNE